MSVKIKPVSEIITDLNLEPGGKAHNKFASECMDRMNKKYTPFDKGILAGSSYVDSDCNIHYNTPYARYLYYGKLMVMENGKGAYYDPEYGFWSDKGKKKKLTETDLNYSTSINAQAGPYWDKRMWSAEKSEIEQVMNEYIRQRGSK